MDMPEDIEDYGPVRVSSQGQVTIPKPIRDALGLGSGPARLYAFGSSSRKQAWLVSTERLPREVAEFLSGRRA